MGLYHFFLLQALHVEICFSGKKSDIMVVPSKLCCTGSISRSYVICDRLIRVFSQSTKKSHGDKFHTARHILRCTSLVNIFRPRKNT